MHIHHDGAATAMRSASKNQIVNPRTKSKYRTRSDPTNHKSNYKIKWNGILGSLAIAVLPNADCGGFNTRSNMPFEHPEKVPDERPGIVIVSWSPNVSHFERSIMWGKAPLLKKMVQISSPLVNRPSAVWVKFCTRCLPS